MNLFLFTYSVPGNYSVSERTGVFGAKKDGSGLETKVKRLRRGDLILIRESGEDHLCLVGCCKVLSGVFDQLQRDRRAKDYSPFRDILWIDEEEKTEIIYPLRLAVDFTDAPKIKLFPFEWHDLTTLGWRNENGEPLNDNQGWAKKFAGNLVTDPKEKGDLCRLLEISSG